MKKIITGVLTLSLFTFSVNAQIDRVTNPQTMINRMDRDDLREKPNLSQTQKEQMKVINDDIRTKMMALKNSNTGADMSTQRQTLMQERKNRIGTILTSEQKNQFDQQVSRIGERGEGRKDETANGRKEDKDENAGPGKDMNSERANKMQPESGLSADQSAKLKETNQSFMIRIKNIKENETLSREQKMQQFKVLQAERQSGMKNILTADQWAKYEQIIPNKGGFKEKYKDGDRREK